jgi:hypothetical protein
MDSPFFAVLITDIIFIAFALGLNKKNAKYLLSGYNTMSEKERENFDIEITILINLLNAKIAVLTYSSYIIIMLIWFVFKVNKFKIKQ